MQRFTLHVPELYNDGTPVGQEALAAVEDRILGIADGFTLTHGIGVWRDEDSGEVYREPMRLYAIDADETKRLAVHHLADAVALAFEQLATYVTEQTITPHLASAQLVRA